MDILQKFQKRQDTFWSQTVSEWFGASNSKEKQLCFAPRCASRNQYSSFCLMARRAHCSGRCFAHSLTRGSTQVKSCKVLVHYIMILHAFLTGFLHVFYPQKSQHWIFADLNMFCPIWTHIPSLLLGSLYLHAFNASNRTSHNNFFDSDCLGLGSLAISIAPKAFWPDCSGNCALWSVSTRDWWGRCAAHGFDMDLTWEAYCVNLCHCRAKVRGVALPLGKLGVRMVRLVSRVSWPTEMHCTREHKWVGADGYFHISMNLWMFLRYLVSFASRTSAKVKICVSLAAITAVQAEEKAGNWRTENSRTAPAEGIHKVYLSLRVCALCSQTLLFSATIHC